MAEMPPDKQLWERQYESGRWDYLAGDQEYFRYALIGSFLRRQQRPLRILDIGCGEGVLLRHLNSALVAGYTGLDLAQAALDQFHPKRDGHQYLCGSLEDFAPSEKWDAIVFNEVLYYTRDPVAQLRKFETSLNPGGIMIVSIYRKPNLWASNNRCARRVKKYFMEANYGIVEALEISKVRQKMTWEIYVVKPPAVRQ